MVSAVGGAERKPSSTAIWALGVVTAADVECRSLRGDFEAADPPKVRGVARMSCRDDFFLLLLLFSTIGAADSPELAVFLEELELSDATGPIDGIGEPLAENRVDLRFFSLELSWNPAELKLSDCEMTERRLLLEEEVVPVLPPETRSMSSGVENRKQLKRVNGLNCVTGFDSETRCETFVISTFVACEVKGNPEKLFLSCRSPSKRFRIQKESMNLF